MLVVTRKNVQAYEVGGKIFVVDPVDGRARDIRSGKEPSKEEAWALKDYWEYEYYQEKKEQERVRDLEEKNEERVRA